MPNAHFFCKTGPLAGAEYRIDEEATIGRGEENVITLSSETVADEQARIYFDSEAERYFLENRASPGSIQLDGVAVDDTIPLRTLHIVTLAENIDFIFYRSTASVQPSSPASDDESEKTQIGADFGPMPNLPDDTGDEGNEEDDRTRIGRDVPDLPDIPERLEQSDDDETQIGADMGAMPDLSASDEPTAPDSPGEEQEQTRIGGMSGPMPSLPDSPSGQGDSPEEEDEPAPHATPQFELKVSVEDQPDREPYALRAGTTTLGRAEECDIQVDDRGVSREHARLIVEEGSVRVEDMGSKNFTFINGERMSGPANISPGDKIHFGLQVKAELRRAES